MKRCNKCSIDKQLEDFHLNRKMKDGRQNYCKACMKVRNASYYKLTPERNPQRQLSRDKCREQCFEYVCKYLQEHPCVDCNESDIVVLEFDHVRGTKVQNIATLCARGSSLATLKLEIDKCEVRCANCHRRVTAQRGGWRKLTY